MKTSEKIDQLLPDLFKVKASILPLKKQADNPFFHSKYVDLNAVLEGVDSILEANNFILLQPVVGKTVETTIMHKSGQFITSEMELVLDKNTMQALGSAISYARRYSLVSLLGLKQEDDDSEAAVGRGNYSAPKAKPAPAKAATTFTKPAEAKATEAKVATIESSTVMVSSTPTPTKPVAEPARAKPAPFFNPKATKPANNGNASQFD
jgi:hypothetical protein